MMWQWLDKLVRDHPTVLAEARGTGFLLGLRCHVPAGDMVLKLQELGMVVPIAGENVVRVFPPITTPLAVLDEGIAIIDAACVAFETSMAKANENA